MTGVLVIGGGIAGCHAAHDLSRDFDVTLLEREGIAADATGLSAGLVAPTLFYGDVPAVARHLNRFVREFDGTHGFAFTERDRLDFVYPDEEHEMRAKAADLADEGFPVSYLDPASVEAEYPWFDVDGFAGAVEYRDTGWVDPYSYATALAAEAESRGATLETGVAVEEVLVEDRGRGEAVTGVATDEGPVEADAVVVAAGWRTPGLLPAGVELPVRPYRTQVVVLDPGDPLPDSFPLARLGRDHLYFRPEHNGDLLVGGGSGPVEHPERASRDADESFERSVAAFLPELIDGFDDAGLVNGWAGLDAATPDARPVVDAVGPEGLYVATGFNGLGVVASPAVGPTIRHRLTGEEPPFPAGTFSLDRFDSASTAFEYLSTYEL